ncbi:tetratricopeptide repeat protein [Croceicoccus ponticola]|uniref:Tetratricopeptide repeat protein n=1 Tax=Croceicoccus ponticola TaxID=2217664 RepID=A0A437GVX4_9SPHN|nr:tetratricopeptide repeat protein [Croceicoccus ponticola]RVQ64730.1 tetratricopeptide repeat protein [Croceicoccus ponticola]
MRDDLLAEAARLAQGATPGDAAPLVARLLSESPHDADVLTLAGIVAQRTGRADTAIANFRAARDADRGNPARHQNVAVALKNKGEFDAALAAFEEALALRPGHGATLANMGSCLLAANRVEEALAVLDRALDAAPDHADALNSRGVALARLGRHGQAVETYREALAVRPGHIETRLNLGDALSALGKNDDAAQIAKGVLADRPDHPRAANQLGLLREKAGDFAGAADALRQGFDPARPNHALGINMARCMIRAGQAEAALQVCERMLATSPSVTTPLAMASVAMDRMGAVDRRKALMGVDRFVTIHDIDAVEGFAGMEGFNAALIAELRAHPTLTEEPEGLVTRQGRQSGDLANDTTPAIAALAGIARDKLGAERDRLASIGGDHPFLRAMPDRWSLTLWGTILRAGGEVGAHIHAPNWLSGVYYPDFRANAEDANEGAFTIGPLPAELGEAVTAPDVIHPRTGRMILFPSYLWHGTLPFAGEDRISFAFDLVPEGIGRPHSLR